MDKHRPKRPTTLDLFPRRQAQTGSQDSINNNSLGKKDSWKVSPGTTGDVTAKAEDKGRHGTRRLAPKPPTTNGPNGRSVAHGNASDARVRTRENPPSSATPRTQRRAGVGGAFPARGGGRGGTAMRDKNQGDVRRKDGATVAKEERKGGRLCEETKTRDRDRDGNGHSRLREGAKGRGGKGKGGAKGANKGGGVRASHMACNQEVYLTAMVVPRTPVAPRTQDTNQNQGQNHDRPPDTVPALSRSSSEGGSNRMSLGSDTEGPPPGPPHPSIPHPTNPDITEEEGEGEPTPGSTLRTAPVQEPQDDAETDSTKSEVDAGGGVPAPGLQDGPAQAAGLCYDAVKYTLVVDQDARLELVSLKDCFHGYNNKHNDDSDAETVYQSANEEEDPEYEEERRRKEEKKQGRRGRQKEEEEMKRRREEEVKRRREVVARICKQPKITCTSRSEEDERSGGPAFRSRKFLNLFAKEGGHYSTAGAGSFGLFSCVLDGAEHQQSHRAVYRFVPRHEDELCLEIDDPVLILDQSEDLWCRGYNMRSGSTGIFPAFYAVEVAEEPGPAQKKGWTEQFQVRFLGSVQVPVHKGNGVLCAAMQKVVGNRQPGQPPSVCLLEVSVRGVKISVQDRCPSAHRGDQCFHFFHLKNISFCGCHPKHSKYFGFISKHPEQQRFACHVMVSETTLHPLAQSVGRAFQQYYREHVGVFCPTEDIFIE